MPNLYWPHHLWRNPKRSQRRRLARWAAAERSARSVLVVSHSHCLDGVGAAIITMRALGRDEVGVCYVQPSEMADVLSNYAQVPGRNRRLLVADLSLQPDQYDAIVAACGRLRAGGWKVEWRDHHEKQWEGLDLSRLEAELVALEVNDDATESGASLQARALAPKDGYLRRLAETIRDRDLWWNRTPDSETLEFALSQMGTDAFTEEFLAAPSSGPVVTAAVAAAAQRERDEQVAIRETLVGKARFWGEGPTRVGVVYGWLPKNTGLHELLHDEECQVAINVRPNGKVSLRSRKEAKVCHLVARQFGGGGHPNASGADLGLAGVPYWRYVITRGRVPQVDRLASAAVEVLRGNR